MNIKINKDNEKKIKELYNKSLSNFEFNILLYNLLNNNDGVLKQKGKTL